MAGETGPGNDRFQSAAAAGLTEASVARLKLKWAFGYPGGTSAYGQPTVVGGRVFVGTDIGYVYSLDAASGCVYWSYRAGAGVRNAMTVGPIRREGGIRYAVFFGDLKASAYAIDAQDGSEIWKTLVEDHYAARVTAAPALYQGRLYVPISAWEGFQARVPDYPCCTAVGSVSALNASYRQADLEDVHDRRAAASDPAELARRTAVGARRSPDLEYADRRCQTPGRLRRNRGCLNLSRASDERCDSGSGHGDAESCAGRSRSTSTIRSSSAAAAPGSPRTARRWWDRTGISRCHRCSRPSRTGETLLVFGTKPGEILALDPAETGPGRLAHAGRSVMQPCPTPWVRMAAQISGRCGAERWMSATPTLVRAPAASAAVRLSDGLRVWDTPLNSSADNQVTHSAALTVIPGIVFLGGSDGTALGTVEQRWAPAVDLRDGAYL